MSDQNNLPQDPAPEEAELTLRAYLTGIAKGTFATIKTALFLSPLFIIAIIVILSLLGPSVGNVFSNIVNAL
jgi:hypothetical protein